MEYAYSEQVKVVEGMCDVFHVTTKDYLLKVGYEEIPESELAAAGQPAGSPSEEAFEPPAQRSPSKKLEKKKRR